MIYSNHKMSLLRETAERLMRAGRIKNPAIATEIARKWVIG